jgi:hypothetical protein
VGCYRIVGDGAAADNYAAAPSYLTVSLLIASSLTASSLTASLLTASLLTASSFWKNKGYAHRHKNPELCFLQEERMHISVRK